MATVVSPQLVAVDAAWDAGPDAGSWIALRLGPFGASVGHAVPHRYPAYAVAPIPFDDESKIDVGPLTAIEGLARRARHLHRRPARAHRDVGRLGLVV